MNTEGVFCPSIELPRDGFLPRKESAVLAEITRGDADFDDLDEHGGGNCLGNVLSASTCKSAAVQSEVEDARYH